MKKSLVLMAMAGIALASCVNNEVVDVPQKELKKITFSSPVMYNNVIGSRAEYHGEIGGHLYVDGGVIYSYPRKENFQIFAVEHANDFAGWANATTAEFNNTLVSYDLNVDGWAPKKNGQYYFWDTTKKMSFAACSPADLQQAQNWNGRKYDATGLTLTNFKVPEDASKQYDLLFSKRAVNMTKENMNHDASYYSGVPIQFMHALSSIRFSISNKSEYNVVLKKISLLGVKDVGTFSENLKENTTDYSKYEIGTNVEPKWAIENDATPISNPYVAFEGEITFPDEARYVSALKDDSDNVNILLLLPQKLTDSAMLVIEYTVNGTTNTKGVKLKDAVIVQKAVNGDETATTTKVEEWLLGTRYTYRLYYSAAAADKDKIYFAPETDEWTDAGVAVIDLMHATDYTWNND